MEFFVFVAVALLAYVYVDIYRLYHPLPVYAPVISLRKVYQIIDAESGKPYSSYFVSQKSLNESLLTLKKFNNQNYVVQEYNVELNSEYIA